MTNRTIEHRTSSTAGYTCFSRACATREKDERFRGPDTMAKIFLPGFAKVILYVPPFRRFFMKRIAPSGIYEYVIARTKLFDTVFLEALDNRFTQVVVLGAGMDTRALRFEDRNPGARIFELDIPATQQPKLEILNRKGVTLPEALVFVPIDFNKQSLSEALHAAGFVENQKTLFLWEGVTMYLTAEAVDATLAFIRENCAEGSRVVFDYIYGSVLRQENKYYGEKEIFNRVSKAGEGWTFAIEEGEIEGFLSGRGFKVEAHYTPPELEKAFLTGENLPSPRPVNGTHCIVVASVNKNVL
ncbi:MAG: SAM-dependent methyltransferase [Anaerolineales bacterium]|nr:SAM-dependent methyltransferase [Anaerolineales bacterium]